ncbi:MAG TPA: sulfotransferase [Phaeodactylibacter sp.]|nr:sulfotransferase [Phaeodactylibacter sp.]
MVTPLKKAYQFGRRAIIAQKVKNSKKVFCIGRNKTGTTSMAALLDKLGFIVAPQRPAELMLDDWKRREFDQLLSFVKYRGDAFQDIPFSLPETYKVLDKAFPDSKFILTVRDSPDKWYRSLVNFHSKLFGRNGKKPTVADLKRAEYVHKGYMLKCNRYIYDPPEQDPYHEPTLKAHYRKYNDNVKAYFSDQPDKLLVVNVKKQDSAKRICQFLDTKKQLERMPWKNKT